ncbi:MAG: phosphatase PAP2 family protein [Actinomycetota bacterium]
MLVGIVLAVSGIAGLAGAATARHWPAADPSAEATRAFASRPLNRSRVARFLRARSDPAAATGLALSFTLTFVVAAGTLVGVLVYLLRTHPALAAADLRVALWGAAHATSFSTTVFRAITQLGGTVTIVVLGSVVGAVIALRSRRVSPLLFVALVLGGNAAIVNLIKVLVDRARPTVSVLTGFSGRSFPSGHSAAAAACYGSVALLVSLRWSPRHRAAACGAAVAVAVAVAWSRVLLGVHWVSDVMAGLAIGWSWLALCAIAFGGRTLRFGAPARAAGLSGEASPAASSRGRSEASAQ